MGSNKLIEKKYYHNDFSTKRNSFVFDQAKKMYKLNVQCHQHAKGCKWTATLLCKTNDYESSTFYRLSNWQVVKNVNAKPHSSTMWGTVPTQTLLKRSKDDNVSCCVLVEFFHTKVLRADVNDQSVRNCGRKRSFFQFYFF